MIIKTTNDVLAIASVPKMGEDAANSWKDIRWRLQLCLQFGPKELNGGSKDVLDYKDHEDGNASKPNGGKRAAHYRGGGINCLVGLH